MKALKILAVLIAVMALDSCNENASVTKKELKNEVDSVSYALGLNMANQMKSNFKEMDKDLFVQGFKNGIDSVNFLMENKSDKINTILRTFFQKKQIEERKKQQADALKKAEEQFADVKAEGIKFLEENKTKPGVKTTPSGLQYIVLKEGKGEKPSLTSRVKVHYHGTLIDGTVFDSSVDRGKPYETNVNQVIKGWTEGLQLMPVGSKYKFFIPQELAYGAFPNPRGPIKPFSTLIFEVELLDIIKK